MWIFRIYGYRHWLVTADGFPVGKEFQLSYKAQNVGDFWRRWHISLSTFLRDYLYIPLGGNRGTAFRTNVNLMITMLLGGLWHGASWNFVIWGGLNGLGLLIYKFWKKIRPGRRSKSMGHGRTHRFLHLPLSPFTRIWFRLQTWKEYRHSFQAVGTTSIGPYCPISSGVSSGYAGDAAGLCDPLAERCIQAEMAAEIC